MKRAVPSSPGSWQAFCKCSPNMSSTVALPGRRPAALSTAIVVHRACCMTFLWSGLLLAMLLRNEDSEGRIARNPDPVILCHDVRGHIRRFHKDPYTASPAFNPCCVWLCLLPSCPMSCLFPSCCVSSCFVLERPAVSLSSSGCGFLSAQCCDSSLLMCLEIVKLVLVNLPGSR